MVLFYSVEDSFGDDDSSTFAPVSTDRRITNSIVTESGVRDEVLDFESGFTGWKNLKEIDFIFFGFSIKLELFSILFAFIHKRTALSNCLKPESPEGSKFTIYLANE